MSTEKLVPIPCSSLPQDVLAQSINNALPDQAFTVRIFIKRDSGHQPVNSLLTGPVEYIDVSDAEAFEAAHSSAQEHLDQLEAYVLSHNLKIIKSNKISGLKVKGMPADMEKAFAVKLENFHYDNHDFRGYRGEVKLPQSIWEIVTCVLGLDNLPLKVWNVRNQHQYPQSHSGSQEGEITNQAFYEPAFSAQEYQELFHYPEGEAKGQRLGIIFLGGGYYEADLRTYMADSLHYSPEKIARIEQNIKVVSGANNPAPSRENLAKIVKSYFTMDPMPQTPIEGNSLEVTVDMNIAVAMAAEAEFRLYFYQGLSGQNPSLIDIFDIWIEILEEEDDERPNVLSMSFAWTKSFSDGVLEEMNRLLGLLVAKGVSLFGASADFGSNPGGVVQVQYPAASPWVIACGGTNPDVVDGSIVSESVWNQGYRFNNPSGGTSVSFTASGGGVSDFDLPNYQEGLFVNAGNGLKPLEKRGIPDIAIGAQAQKGFILNVAGVMVGSGATSCAAPLCATLIARINANLPPRFSSQFHLALLYLAKATDAFNQVLEGTNYKPPANDLPYQASATWSGCTGLGSPRGRELQQHWMDWLGKQIVKSERTVDPKQIE